MNKPTRYFSKIQESGVAKELGGKTVPNSGARPYQKGDVSLGNRMDSSSWLFECKTCTTDKKSFSIKRDWLTTLKEEKIGQGKLNCALVFNFGPNQGNYYIVDEKTFKEFVDSESIN